MEQKQIQQKAFDLALDHIRKQGEPSMNACGDCQYDNGNGLSCAFRPMIEDYEPGLEKEDAYSLLSSFSSNLKDWARDLDRAFAGELQSCHDNSSLVREFMPEFERNMKNLAEYYKLEYKPETK